MCVRVCVRARARVCVCAGVYARVCTGVSVCMRVCMGVVSEELPCMSAHPRLGCADVHTGVYARFKMFIILYISCVCGTFTVIIIISFSWRYLGGSYSCVFS